MIGARAEPGQRLACRRYRRSCQRASFSNPAAFFTAIEAHEGHDNGGGGTRAEGRGQEQLPPVGSIAGAGLEPQVEAQNKRPLSGA